MLLGFVHYDYVWLPWWLPLLNFLKPLLHEHEKAGTGIGSLALALALALHGHRDKTGLVILCYICKEVDGHGMYLLL